MAERIPTPVKIRRFIAIQWSVTLIIILISAGLSQLRDSSTPTYPPMWLIIILMTTVAAAAVLSERMFITVKPIDDNESVQKTPDRALRILKNRSIGKLIFCNAPVAIAAMTSIVWAHRWGVWPLVITAFPAILLMMWQTWPHGRNIAVITTKLDAHGARCGLIERFQHS